MYNLTDYSLSSLRIIQAANEAQIQELKEQVELAKKFYRGGLRKDVTAKYNRGIAVLTEHNVHLLTAISIVKDRETVNSN